MTDFIDHVEHELTAAVRRHAHLPWYFRLRLRHRRALVAVLVGLVIAGPALAAAGVFQSGSPVGPPVPPTAGAFDGVAIRSTAVLLSLRVPDPAGGLPWGMRIVRTTRGVVCTQVGRVAFGTVGAIGADGSFKNDGRFHRFSLNYEQGPPCADPDAHGNVFFNVAESGLSASALPPDTVPGAANCHPPQSLADLPARIRPIIERHRARYRSHGRVCPLSGLRDVYYGMLGPDATSITYLNQSGAPATARTVGPEGAYLVVLPAKPSFNNGGYTYGQTLVAEGAVRAVSYREGRTCHLPPLSARGLLLMRARLGLACPVLGYAASKEPLPTHAQVATPITARVLVASAYCNDPKTQIVSACAGKTPPGFQRLPNEPHAVINGRHVTIAPEALLIVSFTARVAITSEHSYYYIQTCNPYHGPIPNWFKRLAHNRFQCYRGGSGGPTNRDYKAGQHITVTDLIPLHPAGVAHGDISLVYATGAAAPGQGVGPDVGRFTVTVP